jgi:hypothetical protein
VGKNMRLKVWVATHGAKMIFWDSPLRDKMEGILFPFPLGL